MASASNRSASQRDRARIAEQDRQIAWAALEGATHHDPAGRGLASFRLRDAALDAGQLRAAALHLAHHASAVGIVTGFCAMADHRVSAETDGPPGALFLARSLLALGIDVVVISDAYGLPLVEAGCDLWKLDRKILVEVPFEDCLPTQPPRARNDRACNSTTDRWIDEFFSRGRGQRLSHLVSIERPGPSHSLESLQARVREGTAPVERFLSEVPPDDRDVCHNMRGQSVNGLTAKTHRLFEWISERQLDITTIGIGDGGNELGMGHFAWELLAEAGGRGVAGVIACRIATDFALIGGVSDWAAYALALTVACLRHGGPMGRDWDDRGQRQLIETMVQQAGAVDGLTLRRELSVDGLPLDLYVRPLIDMRRHLGLEECSGP